MTWSWLSDNPLLISADVVDFILTRKNIYQKPYIKLPKIDLFAKKSI